MQAGPEQRNRSARARRHRLSQLALARARGPRAVSQRVAAGAGAAPFRAIRAAVRLRAWLARYSATYLKRAAGHPWPLA